MSQAQITDQIKSISALPINYAARIVGMAIEHFGITDPKEIAATFNIPVRTVYQGRSDYYAAIADCAESAAGCAQTVQPAAIVQPAAQQPHIEERARLTENPSGLSSNEDKLDPPLTPQSPVQSRSWEDDVRSQNASHPTITVENGKAILHNGTRAEWLARFGGDEEDLELALIDAVGTIQPNSRQDPAVQITRRLSIIVRDRREKDKRYQAAVASNKKAAAKPAAKLSRW